MMVDMVTTKPVENFLDNGTLRSLPDVSRRSLGVKLRTLRREVHHESQEDMRDRTGLAVGTIHKIEDGVSTVSLRKIAAYAEALGLTAEDVRRELAGDGHLLMSVSVGNDGPNISLVERVSAQAETIAEALRAGAPAGAPRTVSVEGLTAVQVALVEQLVAQLRLSARVSPDAS